VSTIVDRLTEGTGAPASAEFGVLVVGAGRAATSFVDELRKLGYGDSVLLANGEPHAPYDRPPLSKDVLRDAATHDAIRLLGDELLAWGVLRLANGLRVEQIDPVARSARLSSGETVRWRKLLLATGGMARQLPALPAAAGIHYLRTLDDALRLRSELLRARTLTVLGGGFLGLEIASTARSLGLEVAVVEQGTELLPRMVPPVLSRWLRQRLQSQGVALHLGTGFEAHARDGAGHHIICRSGLTLASGLVVAAIGQAPETRLARECGIEVDARTGGVLVDGAGRTSHPDVFAAGDCAASFSDWLQATTRT
jgi:3-phenylpropionate/trans-cinnamate dioxygenase ferredoxin reductase subunit